MPQGRPGAFQGPPRLGHRGLEDLPPGPEGEYLVLEGDDYRKGDQGEVVENRGSDGRHQVTD